MEGRNQFEELFISYLLDVLSNEEKEFVEDLISSNEKNREEFEKLKNSPKFQAIQARSSKIDVNDEWKQFKINNAAFANHEYSDEASKIYGNGIIEDVLHKRNHRIARIIILTSVAASLIFAIVFAIDLLDKHQATSRFVAKNINEKPTVVKDNARHLVNTSGEPKEFTLPDGTHLTLSAQSIISFKESYNHEKRDLILKGQARFEVAKDKNKPFTVNSGAISTTALGTNFIVTAFEDSDIISVKLFEGSVVIKPVKIKQKPDRNYYLLPGQELIFEKNTSIARIKSLYPAKILARKPAHQGNYVADDSPSIPRYGKSSWYMFNNQPLEEIFSELEAMYNTKIIYSKQDIDRIYFIGTFEKEDSLELVLKKITAINNLKVRRKNNEFVITK